MKTFLPFMLAGLWLAMSCSKSDTPSAQEGPAAGVPAEYTVLTASEGLLQARYFQTDGLALEPVEPSAPFSDQAFPAPFYRDATSISYLPDGAGCPTSAAWFESREGLSLEREALEGLDPCQTEVLSLFHSGTDLYLGLQNTEGGDKPPAYSVRHIPLEGGPATDFPLPAQPVDLTLVGDRLFVLTFDAFDTQQNTLEVFTADLAEPLYSLEIGFEARTLLRLSPSRLLVSYPEKHLVVEAETLRTLQTVRYAEGLSPGFCGKAPLVSEDGSQLFYLYSAPREEGGFQQIAARYDLDRNTAVFYYFENFLNPVEMDLEYEVSEARAIGFDTRNEYLLVGYACVQDGKGGGVFRLDTGPDFRLVDQADLPAAPVAVFSH